MLSPFMLCNCLGSDAQLYNSLKFLSDLDVFYLYLYGFIFSLLLPDMKISLEVKRKRAQKEKVNCHRKLKIPMMKMT